jgi:hypothetical protein
MANNDNKTVKLSNTEIKGLVALLKTKKDPTAKDDMLVGRLQEAVTRKAIKRKTKE